MAVRVLHFGKDNCNRLLVLRSVGYAVDTCRTVEEFHSVLQKGAGADVILVTTGPARERRQVITLARERSHAPLVLFSTCYDYADEAEFDLVIPPLTHPEEWLRKIAGLIEQSRALSAMSTAIRERSALLRRDSEIVRLKSMIERQKSATARAKAERIIDRIRQKSDPVEK